MIELLWHDDHPPSNERAFRVRLSELVVAGDIPYKEEFELTTHEHKMVLLGLHYLHPDNLWSIEEYDTALIKAYSDKLTDELINAGCVVLMTTPDTEFIALNDTGRAVSANLTPCELSKDAREYLDYIVENAYQKDMSDYDPDDIEIRGLTDEDDLIG